MYIKKDCKMVYTKLGKNENAVQLSSIYSRNCSDKEYVIVSDEILQVLIDSNRYITRQERYIRENESAFPYDDSIGVKVPAVVEQYSFERDELERQQTAYYEELRLIFRQLTEKQRTRLPHNLKFDPDILKIAHKVIEECFPEHRTFMSNLHYCKEIYPNYNSDYESICIYHSIYNDLENYSFNPAYFIVKVCEMCLARGMKLKPDIIEKVQISIHIIPFLLLEKDLIDIFQQNIPDVQIHNFTECHPNKLGYFNLEYKRNSYDIIIFNNIINGVKFTETLSGDYKLLFPTTNSKLSHFNFLSFEIINAVIDFIKYRTSDNVLLYSDFKCLYHSFFEDRKNPQARIISNHSYEEKNQDLHNEVNTMTGNIGEWSELYTLFKLLADGRLYAADANTNKIPNIYYDVLKVLRSEKNSKLEYSRESEIKVIGRVIDPVTGNVEEYVTSPCGGIIFTLREYPVVYGGSLIARILGGCGNA